MKILLALIMIAGILVIILPTGAEAAYGGYSYYENEIYDTEHQGVHLYVYGPENGSKMMPDQKINLIISVFDIDESSEPLYVKANGFIWKTIYQEEMTDSNVTVEGNETDIFALEFIHNDTVILKIEYLAVLTQPSIPYWTYVPLIEKPEEKFELDTDELVLLEVAFQKEVIKARTLAIAMVIMLFVPFMAGRMKNRLKHEDFVNPVNFVMIMLTFLLATLLVMIFSRDLYTFKNGAMTFEKHDLYVFVFVMRLLVGYLYAGVFTSSYFVGWKLKELENVKPMLIVSPELRHIELWLVVIYHAEIDGVEEYCIAPVRFGSLWKRLFGHHIKLQRQVYVVKEENGAFSLESIDMDAPLDSGYSLGTNLVKVYDNVILAEDIEFYVDRSKQMAMVFENMSPEELELRKSNRRLWRKKYGHKYNLKPVQTLRIVLADPHHDPLRLMYDTHIVKTLAAQLKYYEEAYHQIEGALPYVAGNIANTIIKNKLFVHPQDDVVGNTSSLLDSIVRANVLRQPMEPIEEEVMGDGAEGYMEAGREG